MKINWYKIFQRIEKNFKKKNKVGRSQSIWLSCCISGEMPTSM